MTKLQSGSEWATGWKPLMAASIGVACGATVIPFNTFGAIIAPIDSQHHWGRGDIQLAYFYFTIASAFSLPLAGALTDRYGGRLVAIVSLPIFAASFVLIGLFSNSLAAFYLCWIILGLLSAGASPVTFTRVVSDWFVARRGLALAVTLFAAGIATSFYQAASTLIVERFGWRYVFFAFALFPLLVALPFTLTFLKDKRGIAREGRAAGAAEPRKSGVRGVLPFGDYHFWVLLVSVTAVTLGISGTVMNLKPLLSDKGMSPASAAFAMSLIGISVTASRLVVGWLIDIVWAPAVAAPLFLAPIVSVFLLLQGQISPEQAALAAFLIGLAVGAEGDLIAFLCAKYFNIENYGKIYGVVFSVFILVSGAAPFLFGRVFDVTGSYEIALNASAGLFVVAALGILAMGRYPRQNGLPADDAGKAQDARIS